MFGLQSSQLGSGVARYASLSQTVCVHALIAAFAFVICLTVAQSGNAATYIVDNTGDSGTLTACTGAPNDCSLRGAITTANSTGASDIINFDASVFSTVQTIMLGGSVLTITNNGTLTINGGGKVRVSGNNLSGVFEISSGANATLNSLTITGGRRNIGAGIFNLGTLSVTDSTISGNYADSGGSAGGIGNSSIGTLNLTNSTVSGNSSEFAGGGMVNFSGGIANVTNSTISGNIANILGGGIRNTGVLNLTNSTISGNTLTNNGGGGITNSGTVNSRNSIIAGNMAPSGPDFDGTLNSLGFNLIGNTSGTAITGDTTGNILNQNAQLGPLQNNGGGTFTHALALTSPARNAGSNGLAVDGNNVPLTTDQRGAGFSRIIGTTVDIGAYEYPPNLTVDNTTDNGALSACTAAANDCSLRGAITNVSNAAISFDAGVFNTLRTITLGGSLLTIGNNAGVIINGGGKVRVSGNGQSRVFQINSGASAELNGLIVTGGFSSSTLGGGIVNNGTLNVVNSTVSGNSTIGSSGSGIANTTGSTLLVTNSTISGNSSNCAGGGGIYNVGTLTVTNSAIWGNSVTGCGAGGAGITNNGTANVTNSTISGNTASGSSVNAGGGIENNGGTLNLTNTTISKNSSSFGGGIRSGSTVNALNTIIADNTDTSGAATQDFAGTLTSQGHNLIGNTGGMTINGDTTGNILNQNARLAPLGFYGGTFTHALLSTSPAINAGTSTNAPAADQRAAERAGQTDMGAFEVNVNYAAILPLGHTGQSFNQTIAPDRAACTYTGAPTVPTPGLTFNAATANVSLSGTPTTGGGYIIDLTVDCSGATSYIFYIGYINISPTVYDIYDMVTNEDTATGNVVFTIYDSASGTPAENLIVTATSSDQALVPDANITLGSSGPYRTINIMPGLNQNGSALITVTARDEDGATGSETFMLTVNPVNDPPTISDIGNTSTDQDTPTGNINFTVGDPETAAGSLTVSATSDNQTLIPNANITLGGSGANRTINITPAQNQVGSATITVVVSDGAFSTQDTFVLTINPVVTFIVDNTTDDGALSACTTAANDCSLRGAIAAANSTTDINAIKFDAVVFNTLQTITLGGSQLDINNNGTLTINGGGKVRVSAAFGSRVFQINGGANATLNGLIITGGNTSANGSGINNFGTVNVNNSTISGNFSSGAGGIDNFGTANVTNSTISGNSSVGGGVGGGSGGIRNNPGNTVNVTNSTISGNSTDFGGGGVFNLSGTVNLRNSTISGNSSNEGGGGIRNFGSVSARNSIIAGNTAGGGPDFHGNLTSQGYNLIGNTTSTTIEGDTTGNILNQNAQLAPLGNYGGGTFTHALLSNSPAVNAGNNALALDHNNQSLTTDQRGAGFPRVLNGIVDMGAFESIISLTVDNTTDNGALQACTTAANDCSLRGAITKANNSTIDETILFDAGVFNTLQTITLGGSELTIAGGGLSINGGGKVIVSGNNQSRVFSIASGTNATLRGITITGGNTTEDGGGIRNAGSLTVENCQITANTATKWGGGIRTVSGSTLTVTGSTVSNNSTTGVVFSGGGIDNDSGTVTVINSTISGNSASGDDNHAGGIIQYQGSMTITNSTVTNNDASGSNKAGGILRWGGTIIVRNSIIAGNCTRTVNPICSNTTTPDVVGDFNPQPADGGYNLVGNSGLATGFDRTGDQSGTGANPLDPRLSQLANNGGGTLTHALNYDSPAINAGNNARAVDLNNQPLTTDQRGAGFERISGITVDIGAYEFLFTAPTISDIANTSTNENTATGNINFTVGDAETPAANLIVTATSDNQMLVPNANITLGGSGANRTINITPAPNQVGSATITVTVSDGVLTAQDTFVLTVYPLTLIIDNMSDNGALQACTASANDCSLRGALAAANSTAGNNTIDFDAAIFNTLQTITLAGAPLTIAGGGTLTVNGGSKVRVSGNNQCRVFEINSGANATLSGLTITGGSNTGGGGIFNSGTVNVTNSTVSGNAASGVSAGLGGGIYNNSGGMLNVTNSTISGNVAISPSGAGGRGGGIYNLSTLNLTNSTISGNTANCCGGGGDGGGIYNTTGGIANVTNSTISGNSTNATGGGIRNESGGTFNSRNSIIAGNTAIIFPDFYGTLTSQGYNLIGDTSFTTITGDATGNILNQNAQLGPLANNGGATFTRALNSNSPAINAGNNALAVDLNNQPLTTDQRGAGFARISGITVDMGAVEFHNPAPSISDIGDQTIFQNGSTGALAFTVDDAETPAGNLTVSGSSANTTLVPNANIDFGGSGANRTVTVTPAANQTGTTTITVTVSDGSLSASDTFILVVNATFVVDNTTDNGALTACTAAPNDCSLRGAITRANSTPETDFIEFDAGVFNTLQTITLGGSPLDINNNGALTVKGGGMVRVSGNNQSRVFFVNIGAYATLNGLTITGGVSPNGSGIENNRGTLNLINATVSGNTTSDPSDGGGGGIFNNTSGTLNVINSTISGNSSGKGGGIFNTGNTVNVINSTISGNSSTGVQGGGGIYNNNTSATLNVTNSTISGNFAVNFGQGGGIANLGIANVTNSTISGNTGSGGGGGAYSVGVFNSRNSIIAGNTGAGGAGALGADFNGELNSLGFNLIGSTSFTTITGDTTGNILNQNAQLAPLGNYGGVTQTQALLSNSPAVNAGTNCVVVAPLCLAQSLSFDQRGTGVPRKMGTQVDIGAFERNITIDQSSLPNGNTFVNYSKQLSATRQSEFVELAGTEPITVENFASAQFAVVDGQLPSGLALTSGGLLSGMPTTGGTFTFTVKATDTDGMAGAQQLVMQILAPTSATVSVSGRVLVGKDVGLRNARVILTDSNGNSQTAVSGSFGYYRFEEVEVGQTYIISISSKRYQFEPRIVFVTDEVGELNFTASP